MNPLFDPKWLLLRDVVLPEVVRHDRTLYPEPEALSQEELVAGLRDTAHRLYSEPYPVMLPDSEASRHLNAFHSNGYPLMLEAPRPLVVVSNYSVTSQQTFGNAVRAWTANFVAPVYVMPEEDDPKKRNKLAIKARQGAKGSQNSKGRRWWESR